MRLSPRHLVTPAVLLLTLAGRPLLALGDSTRVALSTDSIATTAAGPRAERATVGVRVPRAERATADAADAADALMQQRKHHGTSVALMVVGASAVVLGLLVGDDAGSALIVGGAIAGFIGLFQYLR